jgi:glyoxylase-like metal-dependent hydrolase (beta-lactamase superfamily II)
MRRTGVVAVLVAAFALLTTLALAQVRTAYPEKRGLALSQFPRTIELAEDVYGYEAIRQPGFTTVSLFVIGRDGVLIADGQGSPAATQALLDAVKAVTPKPVKWYVVGSDHGDHTAGNAVLPRDITYIIHPTSLAQMQRDAANPNRQPNAPPVVVPPLAMTGASQSVDVGGIEVRAMFLGRAHTGAT